MEGGESDPTAQREFQPVLDAADWCVGVACIQGWVVKDTTCRHHTYKGSPLTHGHPPPPHCVVVRLRPANSRFALESQGF